MNTFLEELTGGIPDWTQLQRVIIRLVAAMVVGAVVGLQRQRAGKSAGLRTHMLVAMGSALFVLEGERAMMSMSDLSRVIQGLATGIGFIGAGAILKERAEHKIEGLTTASGIWMTAAAAAAGLGRVGLALLSVVLAWVILAFVGAIEPHIGKAKPRT
ncbi:MAG: MgtC/SapB family protein [Chthoniobacterales bacterium]